MGKTFVNLDMSVQYLKGVGPRKALFLKRLEINTVFDLMTYFPRDYEDRSHIKLIAQLRPQENATVQATVIHHQVLRTRKGRGLLKITVSDGTGDVVLVCFNQMYLKDTLKKGMTIILNGKFEAGPSALQITNFMYEIIGEETHDLIHTGRIVPIYTVTDGITVRFLRSLIKRTIDQAHCIITDCIPGEVSRRNGLMEYYEALRNIHFPESFDMRDKAYVRLAFEEFFLLELGLALRKLRIEKIHKGISYSVRHTLLPEFKKALPFTFTRSQVKVINEIFSDMRLSKPMNRLLQGDVGSGKTVVALSALLLAVENGYQGVLMAPTEILAEQHYMNISCLLESLIKCGKIRIALLAGGGTASKKRKGILARIQSGETNIIIGTHTLIQEGVSFDRLGLIIIDEQHKFGVMQRALLRQKGVSADVLVMTATPIPRTLALTVYGDLDVSTIDELPPYRKSVQTNKMSEDEAYALVRDEVDKKRQSYIVYPLVEESEKLSLKSAQVMADKLQKGVFKGLRVGLLHGQMSAKQRDIVMSLFVHGKLDILVTTTIIEVGIDVPKASVMVIEHAERFGLSNLHQLRGRVGRGTYQSYCILVGKDRSPQAKRRLQVMLETNDGFKIAEEDLAIRGPGEFFGTRQHGLPNLKIGDIVRDFKLLKIARHEAFSLVKSDPFLRSTQNQILNERFLHRFKDTMNLINVG